MISTFLFFLLLRLTVLKSDRLNGALIKIIICIISTYSAVYLAGLTDVIEIGNRFVWFTFFLSLFLYLKFNRWQILPPQKWDYFILISLTTLGLISTQIQVHLGDEYEVWAAVIKHLNLFQELPKNQEFFKFASFVHGQGLWIHFLTFSNPTSENAWYFAKVATVLTILLIGTLALTFKRPFLEKENILVTFLSFALFFATCLMNTDHMYLWSLMTDLFLGVLFFMAIASAFMSDFKLAAFSLLMAIIMMTTLKSIGFILAFISVCSWGILRIETLKRRSLPMGANLFAILILTFGWNYFLEKHQVGKIYDQSLIEWSTVLKQYLALRFTSDELNTLKGMLQQFLLNPKEHLLALLGVLFISREISLKNQKRFSSKVWLLYFSGLAAYWAVLFIHYTITLKATFPNEALAVSSFRRYLYPYQMGWFLSALILGLSYFSKVKITERFRQLAVVISLTAIFFLGWQNISRTLRLVEFRKKLDSEADRISAILPKDSKIFMICQMPEACSLRYWHLTYQLMPISIDGDLSIVPQWPDPFYSQYNQISWTDFQKRIQDIPYILVRRDEPRLWDLFGGYFSEQKVGLFKTIWKANKEEKTVYFEFLKPVDETTN